ncbi:MAG: dihydrolipoamide acetyltransferase family protein [Candidatus Latescibacterota bacterium]|nr:dihydrolipoamide acetyltransferase family protein [Candidatus Latescibacterota bacterium]
MATEVVMPKLGLTMESGTVGAWLVEEGGEVVKGKPLLEVVTDKVAMEVEAQVSGVLRRILVPEGEEVAVATPIAIVTAADEDFDEPSPTALSIVPTSVSSPPFPSVLQSAPVNGCRRHRASPKARKMAAERHIDLGLIRGTGPGGRIVSADVLAAPATTKLNPAPATVATPMTTGEAITLTRVERIAAERLTASYQQAPHIHLTMEVSANWLNRLRQGFLGEGTRVSYNDLILKAVATTLIRFPRINSVLEAGELRPSNTVDIGIATDTDQGLLVPVMRNGAERSVADIAAESVRLADEARSGRLGIDDMEGGSFTVSNLGMFGVSRFTAIINPPQVAILAVGAIERKVVAMEDGFAVRPTLMLTLGADHRAVDGATGARFLQNLKETLESPRLAS